MTEETNIRELERHCNNYFNPCNDPRSAERNHPPEFLELAERILKWREANPPTTVNHESESVIGVFSSTKTRATYEGKTAGWQRVFAHDLSIYKRAKFL